MFGWFRPRCPVDTWEKAWTEQRMVWLAQRLGLEKLQPAQVVTPIPEFFPGEYRVAPSAPAASWPCCVHSWGWIAVPCRTAKGTHLYSQSPPRPARHRPRSQRHTHSRPGIRPRSITRERQDRLVSRWPIVGGVHVAERFLQGVSRGGDRNESSLTRPDEERRLATSTNWRMH
jgi:hypothetical protein